MRLEEVHLPQRKIVHFIGTAYTGNTLHDELDFHIIFSNNVNRLWKWCAKFINKMNWTIIKELQAMQCYTRVWKDLTITEAWKLKFWIACKIEQYLHRNHANFIQDAFFKTRIEYQRNAVHYNLLRSEAVKYEKISKNTRIPTTKWSHYNPYFGRIFQIRCSYCTV
jgi:hypothetical protein